MPHLSLASLVMPADGAVTVGTSGREAAVKQTQIVRRPRRRGGPGGDPVELPVTAASDTSAAVRVLAAIAAAVQDS